MITETRLLVQRLEDKIAINKFSGDLIVFCCKCDSGITNDHKPIFYDAKQKKDIDKLYRKSHDYCINCLRITYKNEFGRDYI